MKSLSVVSLSALLFLSCENSDPIAVDTTREITSADQPVSIEVTSSDRFEPPGTVQPTAPAVNSEAVGANYTFTKPEEWTEKPASMFRQLNYAFGEGDRTGEVYLSEVGGDLLGNLNRWYGQFGKPAISQSDLEKLPKRVLLGQTAYLVEAEGGYNPGMGRAAKDDIKLIGAIAKVGDGLVTIKLLAPSELANQQRGNFETFLASLKK